MSGIVYACFFTRERLALRTLLLRAKGRGARLRTSMEDDDSEEEEDSEEEYERYETGRRSRPDYSKTRMPKSTETDRGRRNRHRRGASHRKGRQDARDSRLFERLESMMYHVRLVLSLGAMALVLASLSAYLVITIAQLPGFQQPPLSQRPPDLLTSYPEAGSVAMVAQAPLSMAMEFSSASASPPSLPSPAPDPRPPPNPLPLPPPSPSPLAPPPSCPPPSPMPLLPRPAPPFPRALRSSAATLNARFRRSPYTASWGADGSLADAGILIHVFDGWEASTQQKWAPALNGPGATEMSGSFIFAAQQASGKSLHDALFNGASAGIIFRPHVTRILCGKAGDSGGRCGSSCAGRNRPNLPWDEGVDKGCTWRRADIGIELQRLTAYQARWKRMWYNEIIIDAARWRTTLPNVIEAFFGDRQVHAAFLREYGVTSFTHPHVTLKTNSENSWTAPFS